MDQTENPEIQVKELMLQHDKLQDQFEIVEEKLKSAIFLKSKMEREKNNLEKEISGKSKKMEELSDAATRQALSVKELTVKVKNRDIENDKLQAENAQLLQFILEKDKEIHALSQTHAQAHVERVDKGVNTIASSAEFDPEASDYDYTKDTISKYRKELKEKNQEIELAYNSYKNDK